MLKLENDSVEVVSCEDMKVNLLKEINQNYGQIILWGTPENYSYTVEWTALKNGGFAIPNNDETINHLNHIGGSSQITANELSIKTKTSQIFGGPNKAAKGRMKEFIIALCKAQDHADIMEAIHQSGVLQDKDGHKIISAALLKSFSFQGNSTSAADLMKFNSYTEKNYEQSVINIFMRQLINHAKVFSLVNTRALKTSYPPLEADEKSLYDMILGGPDKAFEASAKAVYTGEEYTAKIPDVRKKSCEKLETKSGKNKTGEVIISNLQIIKAAISYINSAPKRYAGFFQSSTPSESQQLNCVKDNLNEVKDYESLAKLILGNFSDDKDPETKNAILTIVAENIYLPMRQEGSATSESKSLLELALDKGVSQKSPKSETKHDINAIAMLALRQIAGDLQITNEYNLEEFASREWNLPVSITEAQQELLSQKSERSRLSERRAS